MRWNPFKRGGGKPAPAAPSSGLGPGVSGPTGAGGPAPKRGLLGRLFGRKPKAAPKEEEPTPAAPPAAPAEAEPEGKGPGVPGGGEAPPKRTSYPSSLHVSGTGTWKISGTRWQGTASGTLTGAAVKVFLDAMDAGDYEVAVYLIAEAYDNGSGFADRLDIDGTFVDISYE